MIFALIAKIKVSLQLLIMIALTFSTSSDQFLRPVGGWMNLGWGYEIANIYFFAMITFSIFTISVILFNRYSKAEEILKILSSVAISVFLSYGISLVSWSSRL